MSEPVLVAYASRYGSTQEVAVEIADTLRKAGLAVDLWPARDVKGLDGYGAVVLGAPLYIMRWHKDARNFLSRHKKALTRLPVAVFALGPLQPDEKEVQACRKQLEKALSKFPWLHPEAVQLFVGKYDPANLGFLHRLMTKGSASPLHNLPASDNRDWQAIRAWASDLAAAIQP